MNIVTRAAFVLVLVFGFVGVADAATLYSQSITLAPGWNVVSTPRILDSHAFSVTENSANFDIYVLDASQASGWATMATLGQTEFTPLYGYFVNNKTGAAQTLTFNYKSDVAPNDRLFSRTLTATGWYSLGVANPTYATAVGTTTSDTNNPSQLLSALSGNYSTAVDFTDGSYVSDQNSVAVADSWKAVTASGVSNLNDLRETKGYAVYATTANALYNGFQNNDVPPAPPAPPTPALVISALSTPTSQNIIAGGQNVTFSNVQLDASASGEAVRINSLPIRLTTTGSPAASTITGCQLYNSTGNALNYGSNIVNSLATTSPVTFIFNNSFTVSKGTAATLTLKCNVTSDAVGSYTFGVNDADNVTVTGVTSGSPITVTPITGQSGTMTIAGSSFSMSVDASSPSYALVAGGTSGVTVGVIKFRPTNEAMTLQKVGVYLSSGSVADVSQLYFYNGSMLLGTAVFAGTNMYATSTLQNQLTLPADADTLVTVKADVADIGVGQPGTEGNLVKINPSSAQVVGQASGSTKLAGTLDMVGGVRIHNTFPTISQDTLSSTGMGDGRLIRFKVTADSHGNVGIGKFTFKVSTTTPGLVQTVQLFGFTDSGYSTGISSGAANGGQIGQTLASIPNNANFSISPDLSPVEVPAGSTYYFELRGAVMSGTNANVLTTLVGDASFSGMLTAGGVSGNLVWSPNATTLAAFSDSDWTNAFGVSGLPSGGIFQSRSQ